MSSNQLDLFAGPGIESASQPEFESLLLAYEDWAGYSGFSEENLLELLGKLKEAGYSVIRTESLTAK